MAWLTGWSYRKSVTLTRASGAVTDYQMKLLLGESSGATGEDVDVGGLCLSSFNDIRFTTSDGETLLDYWIESISGTTPNQLATIWIEFNSIGTSATTFYMYYGNSEASSQYSTPLLAGEATFPFFDNFNDSSLDGEKWTNLEGTGVSEGAGTVTITAASSVGYGIRGKTFFGTAYAMRVRVKPTHYNTTSYLETVRFVNTDGTNQLGSYFCHPGTSWNAKHTNYIGGAYSASSMSGATATTWMVVDIRRNAATNATYLIDNANTVTIINNLTALDLAPEILAYANGSEIEVDWVLVRKYYATEPVWETWGDQEVASEPIEVVATKPSLTITAKNATVRVVTDFTTTLVPLTLTTKNATVKADTNLTLALTELTLTTFNTTVTLDIGPTAPDSSSDQWCNIDTWQWVDNDEAQWGFSVYAYEGLYQIWTDNLYVYAATSSGLDVISVETEQRVSFATNPYGYTTVWSDNDYVFVGTNDSGIKVFRQNDVGPAEIAPSLLDYASAPDLTSNEIKYIHGNTDKLVCCTLEGVDAIHRSSGYRTYTTISGATKCFITPNYNYLYYTVSGTNDAWSINRLNNVASNWYAPDVEYTTGSGFLAEATCLNDFFVTEHTSASGVNNTLFIATDIGVYVYDEGTQDYSIFTTTSSIGVMYGILVGQSTNFTSVWADSNASINNAKVYIGSTGTGATFSVVGLNDKRLIDSYTITTMGENDEFLEREDILDINVSTIGA